MAKKADWKTSPLPAKRVKLAFNRAFSNEERDRIKAGLIPKEMEDKWFIYFEDDTLYLHRSWTGFCIYQICFAQDEKGFHALSVEVNRDPEQYRETDNKLELQILKRLIELTTSPKTITSCNWRSVPTNNEEGLYAPNPLQRQNLQRPG